LGFHFGRFSQYEVIIVKSLLLMCSFLLCAACTKTPIKLVYSEPECSAETALTLGIPGSPGHLIQSERNPNGVSELAHLMRQMVSDLEETRALIQTAGPLKKLYTAHQKMRCSWPTDVRDRNGAFDAMAVGYLEQVKNLDDSAPRNQRDNFNNVLAGCTACHENTCPGPLAVIEKLKL
jgi:hypothetical protein